MALPRNTARSLALALLCSTTLVPAAAQTTLPEVQIKPPEPAVAGAKRQPQHNSKPAPARRTLRAAATSPQPPPGPAPNSAERSDVVGSPGGVPSSGPAHAFNQTRNQILPLTGVNSTIVSAADVARSPQGEDTPIEKVLLQTPGFSQDSAASGALHLRNDHANVQYRIDGVLLPDGVSGFNQIIESDFIGALDVIDGALPAQYGLHTTGVVDITPKASAFDNAGHAGLFGGSQTTISPTFDYGGTVGRTQYFVTGRGLWTDEGIENPTSSFKPVHDNSAQSKFFGYATTDLGDNARLTLMTGVSTGAYQIPNNPGQPIQFPVPGVNPETSALVNETQFERNIYNVLAWQKSSTDFDLQLSAFSRYSDLHFKPDQIGDLEFNGVSSEVLRSSFVNGLQADAAWRVNPAHTLRFGFTGSGELAKADNNSVVFPTDANGDVNGPPFTAPGQINTKVGWLAGVYLQDEWRIAPKLTLNYGARFDQMVEYVDASQLSPRINLTYKPVEDTTFHIGYARYFTPPELALAAPTALADFNNTTQQAAVPFDDPVKPERSHVFDAGVDHTFLPGLSAGIDGYYKLATDLIDDGQFGAANTLTAFNYAKGYVYGVEGKFRYDHRDVSLYGSLAWGHEYATQPNSNQFLFTDPTEYQYASTHYIPTDHSQTWTGSAGASYTWRGTLFSADMLFGSGLRDGFANLGTVPAYAQINLGVAHDFKWSASEKPLMVRFDIVNLLDSVYEIRDGSGIGVFAPQYGPRRGFYLTLRQAI